MCAVDELVLAIGYLVVWEAVDSEHVLMKSVAVIIWRARKKLMASEAGGSHRSFTHLSHGRQHFLWEPFSAWCWTEAKTLEVCIVGLLAAYRQFRDDFADFSGKGETGHAASVPF